MGRYLAWGLCVLTKSQLFSHQAWPNSVNKNFITWPLCLNFCDGVNPHQSVCFSSSVISGTLFFVWFFQQNCSQGHSGHMIKIDVLFFSSLLCELSGFYFYVLTGAYLLVVLLLLLLFFFCSFLVVYCCGMTLFCLSLFHFTGTTKKSEVSKAARRHKDSNKQIRQ